MTTFITASELAAVTGLRDVLAVQEAKKVIALDGEAIETKRDKRAA